MNKEDIIDSILDVIGYLNVVDSAVTKNSSGHNAQVNFENLAMHVRFQMKHRNDEASKAVSNAINNLFQVIAKIDPGVDFDSLIVPNMSTVKRSSKLRVELNDIDLVGRG